MESSRGRHATNGTLSLGAVVRRTLHAYAGQAPTLLAAALALALIVTLDNALFEHTAAVGAGLANLLALALFACFVVTVAADGAPGETGRSLGTLLRRASSATGRLLLASAVAYLAGVLVSSLASGILIVIVLGFVLHAGAGAAAILTGLLLISILLLVPQLFLLTTWSVFVPVVVLERPRGLRAFRRSRELVRGSGWRVLALVLLLLLVLAPALVVSKDAHGLLGGGPSLALDLLLATLLAPVPVLATTALYFELSDGPRRLAAEQPAA